MTPSWFPPVRLRDTAILSPVSASAYDLTCALVLVGLCSDPAARTGEERRPDVAEAGLKRLGVSYRFGGGIVVVLAGPALARESSHFAWFWVRFVFSPYCKGDHIYSQILFPTRFLSGLRGYCCFLPHVVLTRLGWGENHCSVALMWGWALS